MPGATIFTVLRSPAPLRETRPPRRGLSGDLVVAIDGKPAAQWTLERLRAALREAEATRVLAVQRQTERLTIKLRLRRLV